MYIDFFLNAIIPKDQVDRFALLVHGDYFFDFVNHPSSSWIKESWYQYIHMDTYAGLFAIMRKVFFRENPENEASGGGFERCLYGWLTPSGRKPQTYLRIRLDRIFVCLLKPKMGAWK